MNTLLLSGLLWGLLGASPAAMNYGHSGIRTVDYEDETYTSCNGCGESCDDCGDCSEPCGRPCGRGACGDRTACGPLSFVFSIFKCNTWRGPVCGERYWGDFYTDPPECHDPCDTCGNYVGPTSYGGNWGSVRGYSSSGGGCKSCNKNRVMDSEPIPEEGRVVYPTTRVTHKPAPAKRPTQATRYQ